MASGQLPEVAVEVEESGLELEVEVVEAAVDVGVCADHLQV
jgi:hypothetical protein